MRQPRRKTTARQAPRKPCDARCTRVRRPAIYLPGGVRTMKSSRRFFLQADSSWPGSRRVVFAVADGINPGRVDAQADEFLAHRQRAALAEGTVVFLGAALVAVAFDPHRLGRVGLQIIRHRRHLGLLGGLNDRAVEVEIDGVGFESLRVLDPASCEPAGLDWSAAGPGSVEPVSPGSVVYRRAVIMRRRAGISGTVPGFAIRRSVVR